MIRSDLEKGLAAHQPGVSSAVAARALDAILRTIADAVVEGRRVELRKFGVFSVRVLLAATKRNPRTGEAVHKPIRYAVRFKGSELLVARVTNERAETPAA